LGCAPAERAMRSTNGECSVELQRSASLYNPQLEQMLQRLNRKLGSDIFIAANTAQMHKDFVTNPTAYGTNTLYYLLYCQLLFLTNIIFHYQVIIIVNVYISITLLLIKVKLDIKNR
jgi:hypothetical protein